MGQTVFFMLSFLIAGSILHFTNRWNLSIEEELRQVRRMRLEIEARRKREQARRRREAHARARFYRAGARAGRNRGALFYGQVLGIQARAAPAEIKKAYRRLVARHHPDKVQHLGPGFREEAERRMKEINEAYAFFRRRYSLR